MNTTVVLFLVLYYVIVLGIGYWGWRLWRPFDLVLRTLRYGFAWIRQKLGMRNR